MPTGAFGRYVLRTTDVATATAFYQSVLGHTGDGIVPLHEQALARGARPHWLGHIAVDDPAASARPFFAAGAQQLGERPDGVVVLRDPGGAIVALGGVTAPSQAGVTLHVLRAGNAASVAALYARSFGWSLGDSLDLGMDGSYRAFSWTPMGPDAGVVGEIQEGVHPHWLFLFRVDSVEGASNAVSAHGGRVLGPRSLPNGTRYAVCDDPRGAAFGLIEVPLGS